ncbi:hypothetical protein [Shewanella aestuarii]|uniref:Uncharacterized protein n=1 Tax=Shewanella aestuarii TaxID=1028752 RepID=A0A6G9QPS7_9GAMM|nr:hypothetical protein [Shewanella aestuarii]QIR16566.1 hypothetical protein HBH39_19010 [Shewanella aestuarii]
MEIEKKQVALSVVSVKLAGKKLTGAILDQIPRLDFCDLLVDEHYCFDDSPDIIPVARFSLVSFLNSEMRINKILGHSADSARSLNMHYGRDQEDAFFFIYQGQLYCDSYHSRTGTQAYGHQLKNVSHKLDECYTRLRAANRVLELEAQGVDAHDIVGRCSKGRTMLPRGRNRKRSNHVLDDLDDWEDDVMDFDDSDETIASQEYNSIIKSHGTWAKYIAALKEEVRLEEILKIQLKHEVEGFENKVASIIKQIIASPYTILGC